jgi:hypothetical protein
LRLRDDSALRVALGAAGRRLVEKKYSVQATVGKLANALYAAATYHD